MRSFLSKCPVVTDVFVLLSNIHTHLIPFLLWTTNTIFSLFSFSSSIPSALAAVIDTPILASAASCGTPWPGVLTIEIRPYVPNSVYVGIAWCVHVKLQRLPRFRSHTSYMTGLQVAALALSYIMGSNATPMPGVYFLQVALLTDSLAL